MAQSIAGCAVLIYLGDNEVGAGVASSGSEVQMLDRVDVLGNIYTKEIVPVRRQASWSLSLVRFRDGSIKDIGGMAVGDSVEILNFPPLTLVALDKVTDDPVETLTGAVCEQRSWSIDASGIFSESVSFQGIRMLAGEEQ